MSSDRQITNKKSKAYRCVVFRCTNEATHKAPDNDTLRSKWIQALRLHEMKNPGSKLGKRFCVCSTHFKPTDFVKVSKGGLQLQGRKLKRNSIPSLDESSFKNSYPDLIPSASTKTPDSDYSPKLDPAITIKKYSRSERPPSFAIEQPFDHFPDLVNKDPLQLSDDGTQDLPILQITSPSLDIDNVGVEVSIECPPEIPIFSSIEKSSQTDNLNHDNSMSRFVNIEYLKKNCKITHFYTGLESFEKVEVVFHSLNYKDCANHLLYIYGPPPAGLKPMDCFLITLIILRQHHTHQQMSLMFSIAIKQVSNIFITWVRFMSLQWRNLDLWLDRDAIKVNMPGGFYDHYSRTRVILDATEFPIKKPGLPRAQQITFSSYKNKNTVKAIIGIAPSGLITYVSPCYGGSVTDRQIIERSSILKRFDYNDEIMVDKGINVQDIFLPYGVKVNMPAFFKKGNQIQPETLRNNRKVASKRVHVEHVIGLLKTYKILAQPMNNTEIMLSSDIVYICAMLVNFRTKIINKNA